MVTRRDLDKEAKGYGAEVVKKQRGRHDAYVIGNRTIPVPKSREIDDVLAKEIRRQLKGKGWR